MKVTHVKPDGWVDTTEAGVIQPSHVAELPHTVTGGIAGQVAAFAMPGVPAGWLLCDGAAYRSDEYPELFAAIGQRWQAAWNDPLDDGYFRVPDLRGELIGGAWFADDVAVAEGTNELMLGWDQVPPVAEHEHAVGVSGSVKLAVVNAASSGNTPTGGCVLTKITAGAMAVKAYGKGVDADVIIGGVQNFTGQTKSTTVGEYEQAPVMIAPRRMLLLYCIATGR